jgi:hypothetical protein
MWSSGAEDGLLNGGFTFVLGLPGRGRVQPLGSLSVAPHGANGPIQREGAALVEAGGLDPARGSARIFDHQPDQPGIGLRSCVAPWYPLSATPSHCLNRPTPRLRGDRRLGRSRQPAEASDASWRNYGRLARGQGGVVLDVERIEPRRVEVKSGFQDERRS